MAVARGVGRGRPSMAAGGAGLRIDWCGCLCRLHRHLGFVGLSLFLAPWDKRHVPAQPNQLRIDRRLRLSPRPFRPSLSRPGARITHNLTALAGFTFVVYVIQRYVKQREQLDRSVRQQRDQLLQDVELAAQVQKMFLPIRRPSIAGLDIAGMMKPARGVGGDYYDYIPIDEHTIQIVIADVAGKGFLPPF